MIPCGACGHVNPFGTRFCRSCGERIDVQVAQVMSAVEQKKVTTRDTGIYLGARKALGLSGFLLLCALGAQWLLVPNLPRTDMPPLHVEHLLPETVGAAPPAPTISQTRLSWRQSVGPTLLTDSGVLVAQVQVWQSAILAAQRADGSFPGESPMAATGLAALALQAFPADRGSSAGATRARGWIKSHFDSISRETPLARALALATLIDAEEITARALAPLRSYLEDGQAPVWQLYAISELPVSDRPKNLSMIRGNLSTPVGQQLMQLLGDAAADPGSDPFSAASARTLGFGEQRMLWAFTACQVPAAPQIISEAMTTWSSPTPPPIAPEDAPCGAIADTAIAVLTAAAPLHVMPLWFAPH